MEEEDEDDFETEIDDGGSDEDEDRPVRLSVELLEKEASEEDRRQSELNQKRLSNRLLDLSSSSRRRGTREPSSTSPLSPTTSTSSNRHDTIPEFSTSSLGVLLKKRCVANEMIFETMKARHSRVKSYAAEWEKRMEETHKLPERRARVYTIGPGFLETSSLRKSKSLPALNYNYAAAPSGLIRARIKEKRFKDNERKQQKQKTENEDDVLRGDVYIRMKTEEEQEQEEESEEAPLFRVSKTLQNGQAVNPRGERVAVEDLLNPNMYQRIMRKQQRQLQQF